MPPSSVEPPSPSAAPDEVSVLELLTPIVRHWRVVLLVPLVVAVGAGIASFVIAPKYTASTTFSLESNTNSSLSGNLAGLVGLAGQFGITSAVGGDVTPAFLVSILESRELLDSTLTSDFADPNHQGERRPLFTLLKVDGKTRRERMSNGERRLADLANPSVDQKTGIVSLRVEMMEPELAAAVANRMVHWLDWFNVDHRQTQSGQQRRFIAGRLAQAEKELHAAEQKDVQFLEKNRQYTTSPVLSFEAKRLDREVQTKQEVFLTLTKAYEDARIAEVRDTPSITVIDTAVPPVRRSSPHRILMVLVGLFVGGLIGFGTAYLMEYRRLARQTDRPDYRALADAWGQARDEVLGAVRPPKG